MGCVCSKAVGGPAPPSALYCRLPEGVHSHMLEHVDLKKLTKLIRQGRLAPLYPHDVAQLNPAEECPICTVSYPSLNTASCCSARVCTECFVYHQTASDPPGKAQCPFCKFAPFAVRYLGTKPQEQLQQEQAEQQRWAQAKQRRKLQQDLPAAADTSTAAASTQSTPSHTSQQQQQQQQSQQQRHQRQPSWLDELSSPDPDSPSSRRVEPINVYAGYHHRSSSSSGGADTAVSQDTTATTAEAGAGPGAAADEGVSVRQLLLLQPARDGQRRQQREREQQQREQQQAWRGAQLLELQLQRLSELQQLQEAGLLPGYAAEELSGLGLEELDEILLEQALMVSLQGTEAAG